jgi:hypothetical protein
MPLAKTAPVCALFLVEVHDGPGAEPGPWKLGPWPEAHGNILPTIC